MNNDQKKIAALQAEILRRDCDTCHANKSFPLALEQIAELQRMVARLVGALLVSGTITSDAKKEYLDWLERNVEEEG